MSGSGSSSGREDTRGEFIKQYEMQVCESRVCVELDTFLQQRQSKAKCPRPRAYSIGAVVRKLAYEVHHYA